MNLLSEVSDISLDGDIFLADGWKVRKDVIIIADGIRVSFLSFLPEAFNEGHLISLLSTRLGLHPKS